MAKGMRVYVKPGGRMVGETFITDVQIKTAGE